MELNTVVLVPTIHRPDGLRRTLQTLKDTCNLPASVAADPGDLQAQEIAKEFGAIFSWCDKPKLGGANAWNQAMKAAPNYDGYFLGSDDIIFMPNWWDEVLKELEKLGGDGLVGINDGRWGKEKVYRMCATHYLVTRKFIIEHNGGVAASPFYRCDYTDMEANARARKAGKWAWAEDALVKHDWRGPMGDDGYRHATAFRERAKTVYKEREAAGFPDNFPPIIK